MRDFYMHGIKIREIVRADFLPFRKGGTLIRRKFATLHVEHFYRRDFNRSAAVIKYN